MNDSSANTRRPGVEDSRRSSRACVLAASTTPSTPTAVTIAEKRVVVLMPDAMPVRCGGTHAMIAFCVSPFMMPAPHPVTNMPSATSR